MQIFGTSYYFLKMVGAEGIEPSWCKHAWATAKPVSITVYTPKLNLVNLSILCHIVESNHQPKEKYMKQSSSDHMSHSDAGKLGYEASKKTRLLNTAIKQHKYYINPNRCLFCDEIIPYEKKQNKFCTKSCAATFNNKGVRRHGKAPLLCATCNLPTRNYKTKFCSEKCSIEYKSTNKQSNKISICHCGNIIKTLNKSFCSNQCFQHKKMKDKYNLMKTKNIPIGPNSLRNIMLYVCDNKCEICNRAEWNNQPIPVVIDHIDGHSNNNKLSNLRIICCNCDALLPTYKGRNKNSDRQSRRKRYKDGKTY